MTLRMLCLTLSGVLGAGAFAHAQTVTHEINPGMTAGHPMIERSKHSPRREEGMQSHLGLYRLFKDSGKHGARMGAEQVDKMVEHLLLELNGTPEQRKKITDIALAARSDLQAMREPMRAQHQKGMDLMFAKALDVKAIDKHHAEHNQLREKMDGRMHRAMVDVLQVLTPEQREQMKQKMQSRMKGSHGHRHGGMSSSALLAEQQARKSSQR